MKNNNDNTRFRGGLPSLKWLLGRTPDGARAVALEIRNARHQTHADSVPGFLNPISTTSDDTETHSVPGDELTSETMAEPSQDGPDEVWQEVLHEIRPTERDICRSLGWTEWPFTGRSGPLGWSMRCHCGMLVDTDGRHLRPAYDNTRAHLAGMVFATGKGARKQRDGLLVRYRDAKGAEQRPSYTTSKPRGGKRPHRTKAAVADYLDMSPAVASPLCSEGHQRPISDAPALMPMLTPQMRKAPDALDKHGRYGVAEGRAELVALGIDGSVAFDLLLWPAMRHTKTVTANGSRFLAGITGTKQTASVPAPTWQEPEGKPLSPILEIVASRGTLADIGTAVRDKSKPATARHDRLGKRALLAEAEALVAANENAKRKLAA